MDYYKTLEISRSASKDEIKKAYRRLAVMYHPDSSGWNSRDEFIKINTAYETLIDDTKKNAYDDNLNYNEKYKYDSSSNTYKQRAYNAGNNTKTNKNSNQKYNAYNKQRSENNNYNKNTNNNRNDKNEQKRTQNDFTLKEFYQKYKDVKYTFAYFRAFFIISWQLNLFSIFKIINVHFFVGLSSCLKEVFFSNFKPKKYQNDFLGQIKQMILENDFIKHFIFSIIFIVMFLIMLIIRDIPILLARIVIMFLRGIVIYVIGAFFLAMVALVIATALDSMSNSGKRKRRR